MKTINNEYTYELIINKSRFICKLLKINNKEDALKKLNEIKNEYKGASHYCYGYTLVNYQKASDDKEPVGTAGIPILNVLKNNNLVNVLCVVIRYFGGIKLGVGGLTRAYVKSVTEALENAEIVELDTYLKIELSYSYDYSKNVDFLLKECINKEITYKDNIILVCDIKKSYFKEIEYKLQNTCLYLKIKNEFSVTVQSRALENK